MPTTKPKETRHIGAPFLARAFSLCSYAAVLVVGVPCFSPSVITALAPGSLPGQVNPAAAAACRLTWLGYLGIFIVESIFAIVGPWITLYSWKPSDVLGHHVGVVIGGSGIAAVMLASPTKFVAFAETHPPVVAVTGACAFTCMNELLKVAQTFMPQELAEGQLMSRLSSGVALFVLLSTMPFNVYAACKGVYLITQGLHEPLQTWMLVAHCVSYLQHPAACTPRPRNKAPTAQGRVMHRFLRCGSSVFIVYII